MKQKDKNIIIVIIFLVLFILIWTITKYNTTKRQSNLIKQESEQLEENAQDTQQSLEDVDAAQTAMIKTITPTKLQQAIFVSDDLLLIDIRSKEDFIKGHIRDSFHVDDVDDQKFANTIVLLSDFGTEDPSMLTAYNKLPTSSTVYNLSGGLAAWEAEHFNLIKSDIEKTFENQSKVSSVEPRDLNAVIENKQDLENILIIDTRRSGNYEKERIANSINMPFDNLEKLYKDIPTAKTIYLYGVDEDASFKASVLLYDLGISGIKTINGGLEAWKKYGYPTITTQ